MKTVRFVAARGTFWRTPPPQRCPDPAWQQGALALEPPPVEQAVLGLSIFCLNFASQQVDPATCR